MEMIRQIGRRCCPGRRRIVAPLVAAAACMGAAPPVNQPPHHHHEAGPVAAPNDARQASVTNQSLYDLGIKVTRSDGIMFDLSALKGRPTIMTMFFAACPDVCPLMTEHIMQMERRIPDHELKDLQVVFVSFDDRDRPAVLEAYRKAHGIRSSRWTVAVASPAVSETLGGILDVRFQKLPNGSYSHTAMVGLIAADGTILARVPATSLDDPQFGAAVRAILATPAVLNP